jgi:hypothetical protein
MATGKRGQYIYSNENKQGVGVNGIRGDRFESVPGWEHGTVGFAGNVYSRLASENGIQPVDPAVTASREPFKVGRFLLKVLRTVPFFDDKVTAAWRYIIEDTATEFSGIQSYTFETFQKTHGVVRQNSTYTGIYKENNGEFSIKVPETAGQLVRKSIDYWHYGCSDPKTGVAHFYGKNYRDLQPNKSMTILYVLLGPTCRPEDIEYAAIYHDCIVTTPKHDHNNAGTLGDAGQGVEHDLTFQGTFDRGPEVDRLAAIIVDREGLYEERSQNAVLPSYIYNQYMGVGGDANAATSELSDANVGMTIVDRLANEVSAAGSNSSSSLILPSLGEGGGGLGIDTSPNGYWDKVSNAAKKVGISNANAATPGIGESVRRGYASDATNGYTLRDQTDLYNTTKVSSTAAAGTSAATE